MKTIPDFPNYSITRNGKVWSHINRKWLTPIKLPTGYLYVNLYNNGVACHKYIHRTVLNTYIGSCPNNMECCHSDGNKSNNNLSNLRWDTKRSNMQEAAKAGNFIGEKSTSAKLTEQKVRMIIYMYNTKLFQQIEIAKIYDVSPATICMIIKRKRWKHIWKN